MSFLDRWVSHRGSGLALFAGLTLFFGVAALGIRVKAPFENLIPKDHPAMRVFLSQRDSFGHANVFLIALIPREGTIFTPAFLRTLEEATNDVLQLPGVDRGSVYSLFTPNVRTLELKQGGYEGENVVPTDFAGTPEDLARVQRNVPLSEMGKRLVGRDFRGALIRGSLLTLDPITGSALDTAPTAIALDDFRKRHETDSLSVHILGFAKLAGDMGKGARAVILFFLLAGAVTVLLLRRTLGSWRLAAPVVAASLLPVIWLMGLLRLLGYGINPLSMLIPFLVFALGMSHAAQFANAWVRERRKGHPPPAAAVRTIGILSRPAILALCTDAFGFLVLFLVPVPMVQEIGLTASIGAALIVLSDLVLLPILLSFVESLPAPRRRRTDGLWPRLTGATRLRPALLLVLAAICLAGAAAHFGRRVVVGGTRPGVAELGPEARYNRDWIAVRDNFPVGLDVLTVYVRGPMDITQDFDTLSAIDQFAERLRATPGVSSVFSPADSIRAVNVLQNEGFPKWAGLPHHPAALGGYASMAGVDQLLMNADANALQILVFLKGTTAAVLKPVMTEAANAARDLSTPKTQFLLAGGNAGVVAACNDAVSDSRWVVTVTIWILVGVSCLLTFRSLRGALAVTLPLGLASLMLQALMGLKGLGITLSTLPVISLGIGVGIDFGIYLYEVYTAGRLRGLTREEAFLEAYRERGGMVAFTAVSMALGVGLWVYSPLQLQADMGGLLAFLFLANAVGAFLLMPALVRILEGIRFIGGPISDGSPRRQKPGSPQAPPPTLPPTGPPLPL